MNPLFFSVVFVFFLATASALAAPTNFTRALRVGSRGGDVVALQDFLKSLPEIYPEGLVTGYFGKATEAAVKRFQKKYAFEQVGIVGPKTREKLNILFTSGIVPVAIAPPVSLPVVVPAPAVAPISVAPVVPVDISPPLIRLLAAGNIARDSVVVTWATDEPSDSRVEHGMSTTYDNAPVTDLTLRTMHSLRVINLIPGVLYHFRASSKDAAGNVRVSDDSTVRTLVNELSQSTPGVCVVADTQKDLRAIGFGDDNIGIGYLKDRRAGAFTLDELRAGCRAEDFVVLANNYCDMNPGATVRKYLVTYRGPNDVADAVDFCATCAAVQCPLKR